MKERLGFEARIFRPKEPYWSLFLENGTVLGLVFKQCVKLEIFIFHIFSSLQVGLLHRNEIDISPVSLQITRERAAVADYSIPLYTVQQNIFL